MSSSVHDPLLYCFGLIAGNFTMTFSRRHGFRAESIPIVIRNDAPPGLRHAILVIARNHKMSPTTLREIVCGALLVAPNPENWGEGNVYNEAVELITYCPWFRAYDVAEAIYALWASIGMEFDANQYQDDLNDYFQEYGIGWQMTKGIIEFRGPSELESTISAATEVIESAGLSEAPRFLKKARMCLSQRPEPNTEDVVSNAMKALEAVARYVSHQDTATLGDIIKSHRDLFRAPLDKAVTSAWGFASEEARHGREGQKVEVHEAELIVGLAASISAYLLRTN